MKSSSSRKQLTIVVDPHHIDAVPDVDPDSTYHPDADPNSDFLCGSGCGSGSRFLFDADPDPTSHSDAESDPDPDPSFQIKDQTLEKVLSSLKKCSIMGSYSYILACHLQN